jgi:UDP-glucose 4-epimerase
LKILVTGGAGFIGSHLTDRLVKDGHQVSVLDNLVTGRKENLSTHLGGEKVEFIEGSILDLPLLDKLIKESDYVFHLAAAVGVFNIVNHPLDSLKTNIRGTENVLESALNYSKPVFITSSSEVYGKNTSDSLRESDDRIIGTPVKLRWSYSEAKAIDESLAYAYWVEKKLETRIVRLFNTVGPRQLGAYGMVVPRFVQAALKNEPITIYGSGEQTRCFGHVYDVIDAMVRISLAQNTIGKVVNIGNNFEISINDLAAKVIEETGSRSEITFVPYGEAYGENFEDMERRVPNIELINELVGWKPQRDLTQMIGDIVKEMKKEH